MLRSLIAILTLSLSGVGTFASPSFWDNTLGSLEESVGHAFRQSLSSSYRVNLPDGLPSSIEQVEAELARARTEFLKRHQSASQNALQTELFDLMDHPSGQVHLDPVTVQRLVHEEGAVSEEAVLSYVNMAIAPLRLAHLKFQLAHLGSPDPAEGLPWELYQGAWDVFTASMDELEVALPGLSWDGRYMVSDEDVRAILSWSVPGFTSGRYNHRRAQDIKDALAPVQQIAHTMFRYRLMFYPNVGSFAFEMGLLQSEMDTLPGLRHCLALAAGLYVAGGYGDTCPIATFHGLLKDYITRYRDSYHKEFPFDVLASYAFDIIASYGDDAQDKNFVDYFSTRSRALLNGQALSTDSLEEKWQALSQKILNNAPLIESLLERGEGARIFKLIHATLATELGLKPGRMRLVDLQKPRLQAARDALEGFERNILDQAPFNGDPGKLPSQISYLDGAYESCQDLSGDSPIWVATPQGGTFTTSAPEAPRSAGVLASQYRILDARHIQNEANELGTLSGLALHHAVSQMIPKLVYAQALVRGEQGDTLAHYGITHADQLELTQPLTYRALSWSEHLAHWTAKMKPISESEISHIREKVASIARRIRRAEKKLQELLSGGGFHDAPPLIQSTTGVPTAYSVENFQDNRGALNKSAVDLLEYLRGQILERLSQSAQYRGMDREAIYRVHRITPDEYLRELILTGKPMIGTHIHQQVMGQSMWRNIFLRLFEHAYNIKEKRIATLQLALRQLKVMFPPLLVNDAYRTYEDDDFEMVVGAYKAHLVDTVQGYIRNPYTDLLRDFYIAPSDKTLSMRLLKPFTGNTPFWNDFLRHYPDQKLALCNVQKRRLSRQKTNERLALGVAVVGSIALAPFGPAALVAVSFAGTSLFAGHNAYGAYQERKQLEAWVWSSVDQSTSPELMGTYSDYLTKAESALNVSLTILALDGALGLTSLVPGAAGLRPSNLVRGSHILRDRMKAFGRREMSRALASAAKLVSGVRNRQVVHAMAIREGASAYLKRLPVRLATGVFSRGARDALLAPFYRLGVMTLARPGQGLFLNIWRELTSAGLHFRLLWRLGKGGVALPLHFLGHFPACLYGARRGNGLLAKGLLGVEMGTAAYVTGQMIYQAVDDKVARFNDRLTEAELARKLHLLKASTKDERGPYKDVYEMYFQGELGAHDLMTVLATSHEKENQISKVVTPIARDANEMKTLEHLAGLLIDLRHERDKHLEAGTAEAFAKYQGLRIAIAEVKTTLNTIEYGQSPIDVFLTDNLIQEPRP